jgi:glycosyltransferase involved in cell wall biosynthesis
MLYVRDFMADQTIYASSSQKEAPLVSVILPTYRRRESLKRAINSVLNQTFKDFELLVMDDGSSDGSFDLIEDFRRTDPRIIHVRHEKNCGIPAIRVNEGIELSKGEYLAFQFDDDIWTPNALNALVQEAKKKSGLFVIVGKCDLRGIRDRLILPSFATDIYHFRATNFIANNSVLFPRRMVDKYGMYDCHLALRRICDWDLWNRYVEHVPFITIDEIVSIVQSELSDSIGKTLPVDRLITRFFLSTPRNHLLLPDVWKDYCIDAIQVANNALPDPLAEKMYYEFILPYYIQHGNKFLKGESYSLNAPRPPKKTLVCRNSYDAITEISFASYNSIVQQRKTFQSSIALCADLDNSAHLDYDSFLLVRPFEAVTKRIFDDLLGYKPLGVYFDDDFLTLHEYGGKFEAYAPDQPFYKNFSEMISRADVVWVNSISIKRSVEHLNLRTVPHDGCIPSQYLPTAVSERPEGKPVKIGYVGASYRTEDFAIIWEAVQRISEEYLHKIELEFWGLNPVDLPPLHSKINYRPYISGYYGYLEQLKHANFDILMTPLLDYPHPRLAKAPSKYYQTAVAGALGIFSDVPQYEVLIDGVTCIKAHNTPEAWYQALKQAIEMPPEQHNKMVEQMIADVRENATEKGHVNLYEAAWRSIEFHFRTRSNRGSDGRPVILYLLPATTDESITLRVLRICEQVRNYGIRPILIIPKADAGQNSPLDKVLAATEIEREVIDYQTLDDEFERLLHQYSPALIHLFFYKPQLINEAEKKKVPVIGSFYKSSSLLPTILANSNSILTHSDCLSLAQKISVRIGGNYFYCSEMVPAENFRHGLVRSFNKTLASPLSAICIGPISHENHLKVIIQKISELRKLGHPIELTIIESPQSSQHQYALEIERMIMTDHLEEAIKLQPDLELDFNVLSDANILINLSETDGMPTYIKDAMASGVLVVTVPSPEINEYIIDGVTGIIFPEPSALAAILQHLVENFAQQNSIIDQARQLAQARFHPHIAINHLLQLYLQALDSRQEFIPALASQKNKTTASNAPLQSSQVTIPSDQLSARYMGRKISYPYSVLHRNWCGLNLFIGVYEKQAQGNIKLRVIGKNHVLLREVKINLNNVQDNSWVEFGFEPILNAQGQTFTIELEFYGNWIKSRIAIYESNRRPSLLMRIYFRAIASLGLSLKSHGLYSGEIFSH